MMRNKRDCVFGCKTLGTYLHRFPHPIKKPELFAAWLTIVGYYIKESDPMRVYRNKRVCDRHFKPEHKTSGHRLIVSAKPTINLEELQMSVTSSIQEEHNYCIIRRTCAQHTTENCRPALKDITNEPSTSTFNIGNLVTNKSPESCKVGNPLQLRSTHKAKHLVQLDSDRKIRNMKNEIYRLRAKSAKYIKNLRVAKKLSTSINFQKFVENMTEQAKLFTKMQYTETKKKSKGRRYSLNEKILALSLYKRSPRCYKVLTKYFTLPSKKSLKVLLSRIKIKCGINSIVFKELKNKVTKLKYKARLCTLIFDEMALMPQLHYSPQNDDIIGFENYGDMKTHKIADRALVFMVKGINANYKQPVAFYFTNNMKSLKLKEILIEVIKNVQATGLEVIATICDQSTLNVSTINNLVRENNSICLRQGQESRNKSFKVNDKEIIPLFDVPHLLKGIRNNLLNKDMIYFDESEKTTKLIKWDYFKMIYEVDKPYGELRFLHNITEEHIYVNKMRKMKVNLAAQIFSHSFASAAEHLTGRGDIPEECRQIVPFVLMLDKLFDSLNVSSYNIPKGKIYKGPIKINSPHHKLWKDSIKMLESIKFLTRKPNGLLVEKSVPSVKNFIKTIEGFQTIWEILHKKYSCKLMRTRNFNQDPVENFFGNIRSTGIRNVNPNCVGFEGAFKTVLLNNFSTSNSLGYNCEQDNNLSLCSYKFFIKHKYEDIAPQSQHVINIGNPLHSIQSDQQNDEGSQQRSYVCGWVLTKCLRISKSCKQCKFDLCGNQNISNHAFIRAKEYNKSKTWLCYPSDNIAFCFKDIQNITLSFLKSDPYEKDIKDRIKCFVDCIVDFSFLKCKSHNILIKKYFIDITINIIIFAWCRSINKIISGKKTYNGEDDNTKKMAQIYYNKRKMK